MEDDAVIPRNILRRNPAWSRDEIILALDFYHRHFPKIPGKTSVEIRDLSAQLRQIRTRLGMPVNEKFRNPEGVYMKMMNFHHFNEQYRGVGLKGGSKSDRKIFFEFENEGARLALISEKIMEVSSSDEIIDDFDVDDDEKFEVEEGRILTRWHRYRERNREIIEKKKERVLDRTGFLKCEGCTFEFGETYGKHGKGFIECHHTIPLSMIEGSSDTSLNDLSLVCSNCHRMIHRSRPWLSMDKLRNLLL